LKARGNAEMVVEILFNREVDQLVDRLVWDQEAAGSSPVFPTKDAYSKFYKTFIWKKNNRILYLPL
jgi:hypothetical protein